ncbi:unnamed protein product, partial [Adineta steineri]
MHKVGPSE